MALLKVASFVLEFTMTVFPLEHRDLPHFSSLAYSLLYLSIPFHLYLPLFLCKDLGT